MTMRTTLLAQANSFTNLASGRLSRNPHSEPKSYTFNYRHDTIRPGQQNGDVLDFLKESEVWELCKKEISRYSIVQLHDEEAFVVFCLAAYVLQVTANDCWSSPRKMMSQYVFYSEVCAILAEETSDPFTNMVVKSTDRGN